MAELKRTKDQLDETHIPPKSTFTKAIKVEGNDTEVSKYQDVSQEPAAKRIKMEVSVEDVVTARLKGVASVKAE